MNTKLNIYQGNEIDLPSSFEEGSVYVCVDTGNVYADLNEERIKLTHLQKTAEGGYKIDDSNIVLSKNALAIGDNCQAGGYAYSIIGVPAIDKITLDCVDNLNKDDQYFGYIRYQNNGTQEITESLVGKIKEINGNTITLSNNLITDDDKRILMDTKEGEYNVFFVSSLAPEDYTLEYRRIIGNNAFASGLGSMACASRSTATGYRSVAGVAGAHAEGNQAKAVGGHSHAEGYLSESQGPNTHAEGNATKAIGKSSHSEGERSTAHGRSSHVEGYYSTTHGIASHAEGKFTKAKGDYTHAEGDSSEANGYASHSEGYNTRVLGKYSHAEGDGNTVNANKSHAEGKFNEINNKIVYGYPLARVASVKFVITDTKLYDSCPKIKAGDTFYYCGVKAGSNEILEYYPNNIEALTVSYVEDRRETTGDDNILIVATNAPSYITSDAYKNLVMTDEKAPILACYIWSLGNSWGAPIDLTSTAHVHGMNNTVENEATEASGVECIADGFASSAGGWHSKAHGDASFVRGFHATSPAQAKNGFIGLGRYNEGNPNNIVEIGAGTFAHLKNAIWITKEGKVCMNNLYIIDTDGTEYSLLDLLKK